VLTDFDEELDQAEKMITLTDYLVLNSDHLLKRSLLGVCRVCRVCRMSSALNLIVINAEPARRIYWRRWRASCEPCRACGS
jgi:MinD superfamily P-loop ATPase